MYTRGLGYKTDSSGAETLMSDLECISSPKPGQRIKGVGAHANTPVLGRKPNVMGPLVTEKMSGGPSTLAFAVFWGVKTKTKMCRGDEFRTT